MSNEESLFMSWRDRNSGVVIIRDRSEPSWWNAKLPNGVEVPRFWHDSMGETLPVSDGQVRAEAPMPTKRGGAPTKQEINAVKAAQLAWKNAWSKGHLTGDGLPFGIGSVGEA